MIELGAQWVHGQNVVYQLASSYLTTVGVEQSAGGASNVDTAYTNGVQIPDTKTNQWWNVVGSINKLADSNAASTPSSQSFGDFFVTQLS